MSERKTQITFQVIAQPAAFSRQAAAASSRMKADRNGHRRGVLPDNVKVWRDEIRTAYWTAIRQDPQYAHFPANGEYFGAVGIVTELYGTKADILNVCKEVEDALNGVAYGDDRQMVDVRVLAPTRVLSERGGVIGLKKGETAGARITLTLYDL